MTFHLTWVYNSEMLEIKTIGKTNWDKFDNFPEPIKDFARRWNASENSLEAVIDAHGLDRATEIIASITDEEMRWQEEETTRVKKERQDQRVKDDPSLKGLQADIDLMNLREEE